MLLLAIQRYLTSNLDITNRLSNRMYRYRRPQDKPLPALVLSVVGGSPEYALLGEIGDLDTVVQAAVYAETYTEAHEIAELIRLAPMSGFAGQWSLVEGDGTPLIEVKAVTIASEIDYEIPQDDGSDAPVFSCTKDYRIHYEREVTSVFA